MGLLQADFDLSVPHGFICFFDPSEVLSSEVKFLRGRQLLGDQSRGGILERSWTELLTLLQLRLLRYLEMLSPDTCLH